MSDQSQFVVPKHIAIIMDGNGRWAQQRGLERVEGHAKGVEAVRTTIESAAKSGVEQITLYAFSTENWGRPTAEVDALMELMAKAIGAEVPELTKKGVRVRFIGDLNRFDQKLQAMLRNTEEIGAQLAKDGRVILTVVVALNYSSRDEIRRATQKLIESGAKTVTDEMIAAALDTAGMPDPDLIVRTSGEQRLSNFLMWQAAYAELYFTEVLWPDFDGEEFNKAIKIFNSRNRRFGLVV
ncbi:MAG: polyprenyl diphosphate synthase [Rikenellaceae bacterium]